MFLIAKDTGIDDPPFVVMESGEAAALSLREWGAFGVYKVSHQGLTTWLKCLTS